MRRMNRHRGVGIFVAGTDTAVGKTVVSAALAVQMKRQGYTVGVMKPVETGVSDARLAQSDAARLQAIVESDEALGAISPFQFKLPLSPLAAAQAEGRQIDPAVIHKVYRLLSARSQSRSDRSRRSIEASGCGCGSIPTGRDQPRATDCRSASAPENTHRGTR